MSSISRGKIWSRVAAVTAFIVGISGFQVVSPDKPSEAHELEKSALWIQGNDIKSGQRFSDIKLLWVDNDTLIYDLSYDGPYITDWFPLLGMRYRGINADGQVTVWEYASAPTLGPQGCHCGDGDVSHRYITASSTDPVYHSEDIEVQIGPWTEQGYFDASAIWGIARTTIAPNIPLPQGFGSCDSGVHAVDPGGCLADPVDMASGAYTTTVSDARLPGIGMPFSFERSYTSADTSSGVLGQGWRHSYEAALEIQPNEDVILFGESGQQVQYMKNPDGSFALPPGGRSSLRSIPGGYELTRHDQIVYAFDTAGRLLSMTDRNQQQISFDYQASNVPKEITDTVGRKITLAYNPQGMLEKVTLPDGRFVSYGYANGHLTSVTDLRGNTTSYAYTPGGLLADVFDQKTNRVIHNVYGTDGRVIEQLDADNNSSTFSWDEAAQTATMTDARGKLWKQFYANGVLMASMDPAGAISTFTYDDDLNRTTVMDGRGNTMSMTYDEMGNLLSRTSPEPFNHSETFTYNASNDVTTSTDAKQKTTTFSYDASGNLTSVTRPGNLITTYEREPGTGLVKSITDARNNKTIYAYDAKGNLASTKTPREKTTTFAYDDGGRLTSSVDPQGNEPGANPADYTTTFTYDAANHLRTKTDPLGNKTEWTYDAVGNLASVIDANLHTTSYEYDARGLLSTVTAGGATTTYGYDKSQNLTSRTDAKLRVTNYAYDSAGRLRKVTSPIDQVWNYEYDGASNLTKAELPSGSATPNNPDDGTVKYAFDELNRLASIDYSGPTPDVSFSYDANSNIAAMTDGSGTANYEYDDLNRVTSVSRGSGQTIAYGYDAASNVTTRTYPDGTAVTYSFDADDNLDTVTNSGTITDYGYDAAGRLISTSYPAVNGHVETRTYDRAGRLTEVKHAKGAAVLSKSTMTLDPVGNPMTVTDKTGAVTTYSYNSRDFLKEACYTPSCTGAGDPFIRYNYDSVGNRTKEFRAAGNTTYAYNDADELTSETGPGGTVTYGWSTNGNMNQAGTRTFTYDLANRPTSATKNATTTTYTYDGEGNRLSASSGPAAADKTNYLWDSNWGLPQLIKETDGSGALLRRYVHGKDLVSMETPAGKFYYHHDTFGSVANITSASGVAQWSYTYEPFGAKRTNVKNDPTAPTNVMHYSGELFDSGAGLYHLRARQYDQSLGRFLQRDPVAAAVTDPYVADYIYVANRPTVLRDPSGEVTERIGDQCGGVVDKQALSACIVSMSQFLNFTGVVNFCPMEYGVKLYCVEVYVPMAGKERPWGDRWGDPRDHEGLISLRAFLTDLGTLGYRRMNPFLGGNCGRACKIAIGAVIGGLFAKFIVFDE